MLKRRRKICPCAKLEVVIDLYCSGQQCDSCTKKKEHEENFITGIPKITENFIKITPVLKGRLSTDKTFNLIGDGVFVTEQPHEKFHNHEIHVNSFDNYPFKDCNIATQKNMADHIDCSKRTFQRDRKRGKYDFIIELGGLELSHTSSLDPFIK